MLSLGFENCTVTIKSVNTEIQGIMSSVANIWKIYPRPKTCYIRNNLVQINDSFWYSTDYNEGERGMVEYCLNSMSIKQVAKYPQNDDISES